MHVVRDLKAGKFPNLDTLAMGLHGPDPIPQEVRVFFLNLVEKDLIKRTGRGRPGQASLIRELEDQFFLEHYEAELQRIRETPKRQRVENGTPHEIALERVKEFSARHDMHLSTDAIKKRIRLWKRAVKKIKPIPTP